MPGDLSQALAMFPGATTYRPGDSADLNAEILTLMRSGQKTASCEAWSVFTDGEEALPVVGRVDIALDWDGAPSVATETLKVEKIRFCDMTEDRIPAQGEFRDLAHWVRGYRNYLTRAGRFDAATPMMVETFRLLHDFGEDADVK